jgi:hypothetical protein
MPTADPQGAGEECQGSVGSDGGGERAGRRENAGTGHHADDAGREAQWSPCPDEAGIALNLHDRPLNCRLLAGRVLDDPPLELFFHFNVFRPFVIGLPLCGARLIRSSSSSVSAQTHGSIGIAT